MNYVEVKNLSKSFEHIDVFKDLSFDVNKSEFVTLLGPSGCGKSTLLRSLAGLSSVDSGNIFVDGRDITHVIPQKRNIGMVFQHYALFPNMTVWQNIAFGLKMNKLEPDVIATKVANVIELIDLTGYEKQYTHQLSGGQAQRVALARALVTEPDILLLDEPLSALDARIRKHLRQQLKQIQKHLGLTTIFVTHDQEEAFSLSDRVFLMDSGAIVQSGTAEFIYTKPTNLFVASFIGNYNILTSQQMLDLLDLEIKSNVAIRPESIYVRELGRNYAEHISEPIPAKVIEHQLLGTIIRYKMLAGKNDNQHELLVDLLNRSSERIYSPNTNLELLFNKKEIQAIS